MWCFVLIIVRTQQSLISACNLIVCMRPQGNQCTVSMCGSERQLFPANGLVVYAEGHRTRQMQPWASEGFFPGGALVDLFKMFQGGPKVAMAKFVFSLSKLRK